MFANRNFSIIGSIKKIDYKDYWSRLLAFVLMLSAETIKYIEKKLAYLYVEVINFKLSDGAKGDFKNISLLIGVIIVMFIILYLKS